MKSLSALLLLIVFSNVSIAQGVFLGYVTGNDYLELGDSTRETWLIGVVDGMMAESQIVSGDAIGNWIGKCLREIPIQQIKAMLEKELRENPEGWHAPAALILRSKLKTFCER